MEDERKRVSFAVMWTIPSVEYDEMDKKKLVKYFSPVYRNVVFRFELGLTCDSTNTSKLRISAIYEDGPLLELEGVALQIDMGTQGDISIVDSNPRLGPYDAMRGIAKDWLLRKPTLNLWECGDDVYCLINITIPKSGFYYRLEPKEFVVPLAWFSRYQHLEDVEKSEYSDVQLISGEGKKFYCHRVVIAQSNALAAVLKNPKSEQELAGEFTFPTLDDVALSAVLQHLYTGRCDLGKLSTPSVIQVADFAEQYGLMEMKATCTAVLWSDVPKKPDYAIDILRYADLHEEKYLKDRALEVLVKNFENLLPQFYDFTKGNSDDLQGTRLQTEFNLHMLRRVSMVQFAP